jgi:hypothetical protein
MINRKYIAIGLVCFTFILGWNVFLVQRDEQMYNNYYRTQAIENLKNPPSNQIK